MTGYIQQYTRAVRSIGLLVSLLCLLLVKAWGQQPVLPLVPATCDYTSEPATLSLTASNVPGSPFSTVYVLVDMTTGIIAQTNATAPVFTGVMRGNYYTVAAHYKTSLINMQAGKRIADVYATDLCLTYGATLGLKVCPATTPCDAISAPASLTFSVASLPGSVTTTYALVDLASNLIIKASSTPSFTGVAVGDYAAVAVHHTSSLTALTAGNSLYTVVNDTTNCISLSNTIYYRVCNSLPIAINSPADGAVLTSLNPPVSGTATPGASVTIRTPGGQSCVTTAASPSGNWTCSSLTFTNGPQSVTATDGLTSATSNFTIAAPLSPPTVAIISPAMNATTTTTPTISGTATPGSEVVISGPGGATLCATTASVSGTYSCPLSSPLPTGANTLTVTACNALSCAVAITSFSVVSASLCAIASSGGVAIYTGGALCATANGGTISLSGQTGNVVKWQTSTNGGTTWTDVTSNSVFYNFMNAANGQQYRAIVSNGSGCADAPSAAVTLATNTSVCVSSVCDNTAGTITVNVTSATAVGIVQQVLATDVSGALQYVGTAGSQSITGVVLGDYLVYLLSYDNTVLPAPTLSVGTMLSAVGGACVKYANQLAYKVCPASTPPTVAIISPAMNGTATATPTISGTATPNAVVTLTGGPGSLGGPVSVTASPTGVYSTSALTFPAGVASVTAVATNAGGVSSPAVNSFTVNTCPTPTVAGTANFTGGPVCIVANAGPIILTGQVGTVVRWETSTDGGATWTTAPGSSTATVYNFANAINNQQYRAVVSNGVSCANANSAAATITTNSTVCTADCVVLPSVITK